jgi:hypothetical protein
MKLTGYGSKLDGGGNGAWRGGGVLPRGSEGEASPAEGMADATGEATNVQCLRQQRGVDCSCSHNSTAMPEVTFINMPAAQGSCSSIYHPMTQVLLVQLVHQFFGFT